MSGMAGREVDEALWWLCHVYEEGAGAESLAAEIAGLPRDELERLLALAVVALMESEGKAEAEIQRFMRRFASRKARP
jgi:hypothetical protein